jgi:methyltransferase
MTAAVALLAFVTLSRLLELAWARRNTARLLAAGGIETGSGHYPLIVALHTAWLGGLWVLGWNAPAVDGGWLAAFVVLQLLRVWVLVTLGSRWTTRIIVVPGERLVGTGPYRFTSHPNYIVVAGEIAVVPLALGRPVYALVFCVLNAAVLAVRLSAETAALASVQVPNGNSNASG